MLLPHENIPIQFFRETCKEHGLKITPQRLEIYKELSKAKDHPSADDIFKRIRTHLPHISFDTVYRTLLSFSEIGLIKLVEGYGENKRFDPETKTHHHLRCVSCNTIIDFTNKTYDALFIPQEIKKIFKVNSKRVVLEGICKKCS